MIATEDDEGRMLQRICDLAVRAEGILLAYVAVPDSTGRLNVKVAAGPRDYLDRLYISIDAELPEGQGPAGRVWREREPIYLASFGKSSLLEPWRKLGERYGFKAVATLPVPRDGARWGIMTLLHSEENVFTEEFRHVVEELARNISRGLDRIDALERERQLTALQNVLLDQAFAGILMLRDGEIVSANKHFCSMLKCVSFGELNGRPLESLCPGEDERERMARLYESLRQTGSVKALNVRLTANDGTEVVCDVAAGVHSRDRHVSSVWTFQDVYERSRIEETLEYYALHDALTGLHNRRGLERHLQTAIARARRTGSALAV
ncbi:MAG TPA: GAF domain-containing protein, partial [Mycobacterium sp.]|nr:GAF domain-containing protein [Mycobacterium sp.]